MLGPMVNPSKPKKQMVGVFSLELARLYNYIYQAGEKQYVILHSDDGYDEISLTGTYRAISREGQQINSPEDMGLRRLKAEELFGGATISEAAEIFLNVLRNECPDAHRQVVCANAGTAIHCVDPSKPLLDCVAMARESIESGRAYSSFKKLIAA